MKFKTISAVAALCATFAIPVAAQDRDGWPNSLTIGTGSQGGTYFTYGSGFGAMISEALDLNAGVEITGGPVQNVTLVETGEHQMGFVTLGPADEARRGESPLMPGVPHENVRALFPMYQTPLQAAVLASSDIQNFQDLVGKRIGVGPAGGTSAGFTGLLHGDVAGAEDELSPVFFTRLAQGRSHDIRVCLILFATRKCDLARVMFKCWRALC